MKKLTLLAAAVAVLVACTGYAYACDKETKSASATVASSSDPATVKAVAGGSCAAKKGTKASNAVASGCAAHQMSNVAAGGAECAGKTKSASVASTGSHCDAKSANAKTAKMEDCGDCADLVFTVADMSGDCCSGKIEKALSGLKNVHGVWVDSETKKAYVCASADKKVDTKAALKNLKKAGFKQAKYVGIDPDHSAHEAKAAS